MSFEVQELYDVIKVAALISLGRKIKMSKTLLKKHIERMCVEQFRIEMSDLERALQEMASEKLVVSEGDIVKLTPQGSKLGKEWENLFLKKDPVLEVVAGMVDGSITGLIVVFSVLVSGLAVKTLTFTSLLSLAAVAITNFSSFFLGGITEDLADIATLRSLMSFSLSDIPDKKERDKSLIMVAKLSMFLNREIRRANLYAAFICSITTFIAGSIPVIAYLILPIPINMFVSLGIVTIIIGIFLVRYRARKMRVNWRITLLETLIIVAIAITASLILGSVA